MERRRRREMNLYSKISQKDGWKKKINAIAYTNTRVFVVYPFFRQAELIRGAEPGFAIPTDVRL